MVGRGVTDDYAFKRFCKTIILKGHNFICLPYTIHNLYWINEELGRHRGREGNKECELCGNGCESVSHVLWECSAYSSSRVDFMLKLQEKLGDGFERFDALDSLGKLSSILGSELWEEHFDSLLHLVKDCIVNIWEARKIKLYGDDSSQSQSSTGDLGDFTLRGRVVRLCVREVSLTLVSFTHLILV